MKPHFRTHPSTPTRIALARRAPCRRTVRALPGRLLTFVTVLLAVVALQPTSVSGQLSVVGGEVTAGYFGWSGDNVEGLRAGPKVQGVLLLGSGVSSPTHFGLTGSLGFGGIDGIDPNYRELGLGGTVRYAFGPVDRPRFFANGYVGWTRLGVDAEGAFPEIAEDGLAVGPAFGIEIPVGRSGNRIVGAVEALWQSYEPLEFTDAGPAATTESGQVWRFGGRVGFVFGRGG